MRELWLELQTDTPCVSISISIMYLVVIIWTYNLYIYILQTYIQSSECKKRAREREREYTMYFVCRPSTCGCPWLPNKVSNQFQSYLFVWNAQSAWNAFHGPILSRNPTKVGEHLDVAVGKSFGWTHGEKHLATALVHVMLYKVLMDMQRWRCSMRRRIDFSFWFLRRAPSWRQKALQRGAWMSNEYQKRQNG